MYPYLINTDVNYFIAINYQTKINIRRKKTSSFEYNNEMS